jgi:hydrogenase maturation protein HypF
MILARSTDADGAVEAASSDPANQPASSLRAVEISVTGVVQGVGFRPFVHRLALRSGVTGWVRNESGSVRIRLEGASARVEDVVRALPSSAPPLARIDRFDVAEKEPSGLVGFTVRASESHVAGRLRHGYPFITCTDCGPRFTVIEAMPYDRERTSMSAFTQCPACAAEYREPSDRRHHSETNSCSDCGPRVWLEHPGSGCDPGPFGARAIHAAAEALTKGQIVALRGLGGFHLAVRADDERAVARLRRRKQRDEKPLALMVRDLDAARLLGAIRTSEAALLVSPERPIVVLGRRAGAPIAGSISPGLDSVAIMLPYTPLHLLLLDEMDGVPLVMTSGNVSEEPIATANPDARASLASIADVLLLHDREIVARYDDSVVRVARSGPIVLRRSRGLAPMPLPVPTPVADAILAVGPHLKNTVTLLQGREAYVSPHVGDLENLETVGAFHDLLDHLRTLFHITPRWVVRDLHPGYLSTRLAEESGLPELPAVQHHHAHVAAVMAEHGETRRVLGLAFDGTGYGTDGRIWGCEFLLADLIGFERVGRLRYAPMPGGDRAARSPWRALLGYASLTEPAASGSPLEAASVPDWAAPKASSLGRLFDAAAAVLGIRSECSYEGQAAMELETLARRAAGHAVPATYRRGPQGVAEIDPLPLLEALADRRVAGRRVEECAADFHESVVQVAVAVARDLCDEHSIDTVALGGGCFQNVILTDGVMRGLAEAGLNVLLPRVLGPNDGAVSYGQAVVTAARLSE